MADLTSYSSADSSPQNESSASGSPTHPIAANSVVTDTELETLRQLILGDRVEKTSQEVIEKTLESPLHSEAVSRVLPKALARASNEESEIARALRPVVEAAIAESVQTDEKILAEHLFPVIGPSTRKSIGAAIGELVQSLNQTLEYSVSPKSIVWRIEALRTGKTFAEVVMIRTLAFQVEQVLLIHKETGLLLQHRVNPAVEAQDADLVSAMLTAIKDFVRDSFAMEANETLDTLEMGDLDVWIEEGPQSILACVVRGTAPEELRKTLRTSQEKIQKLFGPAMEKFQGDTDALNSAQPYLDDCLHFRYSAEPDTEGKQTGLTDRQKEIAWVVALIFTVVVGIQSFFHYRHEKQWNSYITDLSQQPGIVVIDHDSGKSEVSGLRDPLAVDPIERLAIANLNPERVQMNWKPYWSLEPSLAERRTASEQAILEILRSRIESRRVLFQSTRAVPRAPYLSLIDRQVADIELLTQQARAINETIEITIQAYGDRPGNSLLAVNLALERANYLKAALIQQGISATQIKAEGRPLPSTVPEEKNLSNLSSTAVFKVDFTR